MKIALVNNFPPYSGTGRYPYELWNQFKSTPNIEADLYCTHAMKKEEFAWPANQGVKFLHRRPYKEAEWASRLAIYFIDPYRIPGQYDVYHITSHMLGHFVPRLKPCIVTIHDLLQFKYPDSVQNPLVSFFYNQLLRRSVSLSGRADRIICVSEWSRGQVLKQFEVDPSIVIAIHNGVNHSLFKPGSREEARSALRLPKSKRIILHVGSETKRKNIPGVLTALKWLVQWGEDVILVRVGEQTAESGRLIEDFRLGDRVFYRHGIDEEKLPLYYQAAEAVVLPSFDEGFGFPLVEAMACGIPVVTSGHGPMLEVAADAGFTIDPGQPEEIARRIRDLLNDDGIHANMSSRALERSKFFSWDRCARQTVEVYQDLKSKI